MINQNLEKSVDMINLLTFVCHALGYDFDSFLTEHFFNEAEALCGFVIFLFDDEIMNISLILGFRTNLSLSLKYICSLSAK